MLAGTLIDEMAEHLDEVGAALRHVDGHHPIRDALGPVRKGAEGECLYQYRQPLLAGGDARRAGTEPGGIGLLAPVEGGAHVYPALVDLQHLQIQLGEAGVGVELDVIAAGRGIRDDAIAQLDLHCAVTEVVRQLALQPGHRRFPLELLGVGAHQVAGAGQGEDVAQPGPQLLEGLAIAAQVIAGRAVEQPAVTQKVRLPALAQHLDDHHVLIHRLLQDAAKLILGTEPAPDPVPQLLELQVLVAGIEAEGKAIIEGLVDGRQRAPSAGQKVGLQVTGPLDGIQNADGLLQDQEFIREGFQMQTVLFLDGHLAPCGASVALEWAEYMQAACQKEARAVLIRPVRFWLPENWFRLRPLIPIVSWK